MDACKNVLDKAGASLKRDAADLRVIKDVQNGTGAIIGNEGQVGSWPIYKTYHILPDSDKDGMPDAWEKQMKLDPNNPQDRNGDRNSDGYTNLEEYLNSLASGF